MSKKLNKCPYAQCALPDNNNYYFFQIAFLFIGIMSFIIELVEIDFYNVLIFITPIMIDAIHNKMDYAVLKTINYFYIAIDTLVVCVCLLGLFSRTNTWQINILYIGLTDISFLKTVFLLILCANIVLPIIYLIGLPTKKSEQIKKMTQEILSNR